MSGASVFGRGGEVDLSQHSWFAEGNADPHNGFDFLTRPDVAPDGDTDDGIDVLRDGGPAVINREQQEGALTSDLFTVQLPVGTAEPYRLLGADLTRRKVRVKFVSTSVAGIALAVGTRNTLGRSIDGIHRDGYVLLAADDVEMEHVNELYVNTWNLSGVDPSALIYVSVMVQRNHA